MTEPWFSENQFLFSQRQAMQCLPLSLPCYVVNKFRSVTLPIGRLSPEYMAVIIGILIYRNVKGGLREVKI